MKNKTGILLFFFLGVWSGYGQLNRQTNYATELENADIATESVYVHHNSSLLFSGESLKYKFYCFEGPKGKLSSISKIGYVSLIAKDGSAVFNHKIILNFGVGNSDFFIPTSVPTGSYKLFAYTDWMINDGIDSFFKTDIHIVNPYIKLPEAYVDRSIDTVSQLKGAATENDISQIAANDETRSLKLSLDKIVSGKREEIQIQVSALNEVASKGNYSLSVQRVNSFNTPSKISSEMFYGDFVKRKASKSNQGKITTTLPEIRGELISGSIHIRDTGLPAKNQRISLSLPGVKYLHKIAVSNEQGEFYFNFDEKYDNESAVLQVLSEDWDQFDISMDEHKLDYSGLSFNTFVLSKKLEDFILERSIQIQLENAFGEVKSDSVEIANHPVPFYRNFSTVYNLDDFTRFNGIPETIVEVIDNVGTRKLPSGDRVFDVRPDIGVSNTSLLPMVFVDGLFIKRHQDFMGFSAKKVKTISFSREIYLLGAQTFQGVLHFKTIEGNFSEDFYSPHITKVDLFKPQPVKQYFNQRYEQGDRKEFVPDFRYQLLWLPNVNFTNKTAEISFFTSDVEGDYEVILDGFDLHGKPTSIRKRISVK